MLCTYDSRRHGGCQGGITKSGSTVCVCDKNKVLTNVRERNKIQTVKDIKAVKRRVGEEIRRRESRQVGRDMEGFFEHGLGALHRLRVWMEYPADADRLQREYPLPYLTIDERLPVRSCRGLTL